MSSQTLLVFKFVVMTISSGCSSGGCCFFFFYLLDDAGDCIGTGVSFVTPTSVVVAVLSVTCVDSFAAVITVVVVVVAGFVREFFVVVAGLVGDFFPLFLVTWVHLSSLLGWSSVSGLFCGLAAIEAVAIAANFGNVVVDDAVFLVVFWGQYLDEVAQLFTILALGSLALNDHHHDLVFIFLRVGNGLKSPLFKHMLKK